MTQSAFYWIGARDVGNNDTFVWVGKSQVLQNNSALWGPGEPNHGSGDCVALSKSDGKLYDYACTSTWHFICEE